MKTQKKSGRYNEGPLTTEEVLRRDNVPAAEPIPTDIAERLASNRIVLSSDDEGFDPRKHFTRIEGSRAVWELSTKEAVTIGLPVEKIERVEQGSLARDEASIVEAFRPAWQPYIYHPKTTITNSAPKLLKRKNGKKVQPHNVYNRDDREIFLPYGYPWHCVGRVRVIRRDGSLTSSTGTLVGSRTVLTCAHSIPWDEEGFSIEFVPGYFFGASLASSLAAGHGMAATSWVTDVTGYKNRRSAAWDMAVLRLADPLGDWLGTFGVRTYDDDWEDDPRWTLVGYPGVVGVITPGIFGPVATNVAMNSEVPTRQFGISVEDDDSDGNALELEHYADTTPGNSGGPLFGHWERGPYIIGVESGPETNDYGLFSTSTNIAAGGNAMVDLVKSARSTWI